jgi:EAL domain-containing protein (putative c-di-GMP-specific phosphodiesterase class I)
MVEACRQTRQWHDAGCTRVPVSVNLSAIEFGQHDLVQQVRTALEAAGLEPRFLEIELTESVLMDHGPHLLERLADLKALGVSLAIDDFGVGYSSFAYLKRYPIDRLKIDRSFIQDIVGDPDGQAIVAAITQMARSLKLLTVAEGVETRAQRVALRGLGCSEFQGYFVARPMAPLDMEAYLRGPGRHPSARPDV